MVLRTLLQFCQRNSVRADEKRREAMWLPVFKLLLTMLYEYREPLTNLLQGENTHIMISIDHLVGSCVALKKMFTEVLNGIVGYIKLPDILQIIIEVGNDPCQDCYVAF